MLRMRDLLSSAIQREQTMPRRLLDIDVFFRLTPVEPYCLPKISD